MQKIISLILVLCMALLFAACANQDSTVPESTTPEITLQEVYEAGKNQVALLGDHENVYLVYEYNGKVIEEEYLSKEYSFTYYNGEHFEWGPDMTTLMTEDAEYFYSEDIYMYEIILTPNGMVDAKERFATAGTGSFISSEIVDDEAAAVIEKDGSIIVTCTADQEEVEKMGEDVASCEETYTFDAKTREMTSVKTAYTYKDGSVDEGIVTISRDVDFPERMKPFLEYAQETENMRTVTVVSNPGAENEKTESVQVPKGLQFAVGPDWGVEETFTMYADAACTQSFEEEWDANTDLTIYVKWDV